MKLKYEFAVNEVFGTWCAVAVGDSAREFSGVITLNESAADMMKLLSKEISEEELVQQMLEMYDAPEADIRKDVKDFVARLEAEKVLA